ncbi:hypothetical protein UFOVP393_51 [uncultured Caudovirales phage]|uniref:Uncharacterized protein n=1 Tax=uncultured Caudovirales phage TaxID=2100421 RepID=A0A6J7X1A1_9CAUD|nr:hypothetical protein UFOVP393_51 [uncultured Caudovirales phage]
MGQYHQVYNLTKKEYIHAHRIDNGLKLMEQVGWIGSTSTALFALLANSNGKGGGDFPEHPLIGTWAGDKILIQGDYAESSDPAYTDPAKLDKFKDISSQVLELLQVISRKY